MTRVAQIKVHRFMPIERYVAKLRDWTINQALPFWGREGFDHVQSSFIERADLSGLPLTETSRRTMVQARQIYVFAHAALLGWCDEEGRNIALAAAHNLITVHYASDDQPGWVFSVTPLGLVHDSRLDLYAHSLAFFGLAWAYNLEKDPSFRDKTLRTIADLNKYFSSPTGGYYTELPANDLERRQNPHMHIFEAMIAWHDATEESIFLDVAAAVHHLMTTVCFQPKPGILVEYFDGPWRPKAGVLGRICEPGHHYEWCWLLQRYAKTSGQKADNVVKSLIDFADRHGFDDDGLIVDELLDDARIYKYSRHCWPLTEAIKAYIADYEAGHSHMVGRAENIIERLLKVFIGRPLPAGWIDHIDEHRQPLVSFMPSSTLYHVFLAATEADRVWGRGAEGGTVR